LYLIGIAGGSASGKTTFIRELNKLFGVSEVCVVSQDHYYKALSEQVMDENGEINFDEPAGIDFNRLRKDLRTLKKGKKVEIVEYTFNNPKKFPKTLLFNPAPVVIVEGLFIYTDELLGKMFDLKLYIEADIELMLKRRMTRDIVERGMNEDQVKYQWNNHVLPSYERFLLPYREKVDMVILNNTHFRESFEVVTSHIRHKISSSSQS